MSNIAKFVLITLMFSFATNIKAQAKIGIIGEPMQLNFNIPNAVAVNKCHIEVTLPNQQKVGVEVEGPQFFASVEFIPQKIGVSIAQWEGKIKFSGLKSILGCTGSGVINVQVNENPERIMGEWNQYFSSVSEEFSDCVKFGMSLSKLKHQVFEDRTIALTSPQDPSLKPIYEKCEVFSKKNQPRKEFSCDLASQNNVRTICDEVYAQSQPDGKLKMISRIAAIQLQFEGKPWTVGVMENSDARVVRLKQEKEDKAKQAQVLKKEADEKERLFKLTPEYKKQQAALELKKIADEKEALRKQAEMEQARIKAVNNEFKIAKSFFDRKVNWDFVIKNRDNFPVFTSPHKIYLTQNRDLIVNALIQYEKHHDGGISSVFTLKVSNCFDSDRPSFTRIRNRYFSEINGRGVVIKDEVINEETHIIDRGTLGLVWFKVAFDACSTAKRISANNLLKYEDIQKILSVTNTPAGVELYKKYQVQDEMNTRKIRLSEESSQKRKEQESYGDPLIDTRSNGALLGGCFGLVQGLDNKRMVNTNQASNVMNRIKNYGVMNQEYSSSHMRVLSRVIGGRYTEASLQKAINTCDQFGFW